MGWMEKLCEAYDSAIDTDQSDETSPLLPVGFARKEIKYHVVLEETGAFFSAEEWAAKTFQTVPSSAKAESRTGDKGTPFPLADQLKYLVSEEGGNPRLQKYLEQLSDWCGQPGAPACLGALKHYLEQGTLLSDLTDKAHLKVKYYKNADGQGGYGPDAKAWVTFSVQAPLEDEQGDELWKRRDVRESWAAYLNTAGGEKGPLCYVEGMRLPGIDSHPKVQGNAKLISAKDNEYPFQYKGRFSEDRSAANVSFDASIRAHNALSWLVQRQGFSRYGMTLVAWHTNGCPMKVPVEENTLDVPKQKADTFQVYAKALSAARAGYGDKLKEFSKSGRADKAVILGMEAATDGRMSITYYQELPGGEYVDRLAGWYASCCWECWNWQEKHCEIATPTPLQIAEAVMGHDSVQIAKKDLKCEKAASKLMRQLHLRLLSCIVGSAPLPKEGEEDADARWARAYTVALPEDLVRSAFRRSVSPLSFTDRDGKWSETTWRSCLGVTCALIRKKQLEAGQTVDVVLDRACTERDYLYGRLLAVADFAEWSSVEERVKGYQTNAVRLMQRFVQRPFETWLRIHDKLIPYLDKLGEKRNGYQMLLGQIELQFRPEDRRSGAPLSFAFLQGYYCQRQALFQTAEERAGQKDEPVPYRLPEGRSELYGCLLAVADLAESRARSDGSDGERMTGVLRTMSACAARPLEVWPRIHSRLIPYLERLATQSGYYSDLFRRVESRFSPADRDADAPLDSTYLHGYYCMRQAVLSKSLEKTEADPRPSDLPHTRDRVYGRLLGLENRLERLVMDVIQKRPEEEYRASNALRWMERFAAQPDSTWQYLRDRLMPYWQKLRLRGGRYFEEMEALEALLQDNGWNHDTLLDGSYLNEYYKI